MIRKFINIMPNNVGIISSRRRVMYAAMLEVLERDPIGY